MDKGSGDYNGKIEDTLSIRWCLRVVKPQALLILELMKDQNLGHSYPKSKLTHAQVAARKTDTLPSLQAWFRLKANSARAQCTIGMVHGKS